MASVTLKNVCKAYGDVLISKNVDLTINEGEFVVFVGPSGCGKSTLLRCIAGLEDITSGDLYIGDQRMNDVEPSKRGVGMVFQSYALYPHLNLYDNMSFGLKLAKADKAEIDKRVEQAAEILQLGHLLERQPKALSGGQRQRVAIGRTLVSQPNVFLLDEPLSNLDAALRVNMRAQITKLQRQLGCTMIYVTHDQVEAMTLADRIVVLEYGTIAQVGSPRDLYEHPANLFVAQFIGSPKMNIMELGPDLRLKAEGSAKSVGVRPEHIEVTEAGQGFCDGTVDVLEYLGADTFLIVDAGSLGRITVRTDSDTEIREGQRIGLQSPRERLHHFGPDGKAL